MIWPILLVVIFLGSASAAQEVGEREDSMEVSRYKRSVGQQAQLPTSQSNETLDTSPNVQAPFFIGQCMICPPSQPGPRGLPGSAGMPGGNVPPQPNPPSATPSAGVIFKRWGKSTCPDTSQLVYHGVMASSHSQGHRGSGANYLCMPLQPTFAEDTPDHNGGAYLYGVEFNNNILTSQGILNSEAACAVCLSAAKSTVLVVPGTNVCLGDQDWTLEYHGYMMASHHSHFKSEFVCIDHIAEGVPRTNHNNDESTLYVADAHCSASGGGLPCPPYTTNYDILCAVCTL